jgi:lysophospholipase L1-like esterase
MAGAQSLGLGLGTDKGHTQTASTVTPVVIPPLEPNADGNAIGWFDFTDDTTMTLSTGYITAIENRIITNPGFTLIADDASTGPLKTDTGAYFNSGRGDYLYDADVSISPPFTIYLLLRIRDISNIDLITDYAGSTYSLTALGYELTYKTLVNVGSLEGDRYSVVVLKTSATASALYVDDMYSVSTGTAGACSGLQLGMYTTGASHIITECIVRDIYDTDSTITAIREGLYYKHGIVKTNSIAVLGNSTVSYHASGTSVASLMSINSNVLDLSTQGLSIEQCRTAWTAAQLTMKTPLDYVFIQTGINDLNPAEAASVALGRYQRLVDSVNANISVSCKVVLSTMIPNKARLITNYGAVDGLVAYQKWLDMNDAIMGNGANAITGADYRLNAHTTLLNDGAGNLDAAYDSGDGIHENNAGRLIIAQTWDAILP